MGDEEEPGKLAMGVDFASVVDIGQALDSVRMAGLSYPLPHTANTACNAPPGAFFDPPGGCPGV